MDLVTWTNSNHTCSGRPRTSPKVFIHAVLPPRPDTLIWPCSPADLDMVSLAPLEPWIGRTVLCIHFYTPRCASSRYAYGLGYTH